MAKNCFENSQHETLDFCSNLEVSGGLNTRMFYAPADFFDKFTLPTDTGDFASRITIRESDISFKSGKGWKGIDVMVDENELKSNFVGNRENKKAKAELELYIPSFRDKNIGFADTFKNVPTVYAVIDANGVIWIVGTKLKPAFMESADAGTGKKYEDNSGIAVKISADTKLFRFKGKIKTSAYTPYTPYTPYIPYIPYTGYTGYTGITFEYFNGSNTEYVEHVFGERFNGNQTLTASRLLNFSNKVITEI